MSYRELILAGVVIGAGLLFIATVLIVVANVIADWWDER